MRYRLNSWEENGYHDSDFYTAFWDDETCEVGKVCHGTTRAYVAEDVTKDYADPTPEIVAEAVEWAEIRLYRRLRKEEEKRINEPMPGDVERGTAVELLVDVTFTDKKRDTGPVTAKAGEQGKVIWSGTFGAFYRNGYNRPNRKNTRVGVRFEDGRVIFAPLAKFKLAEDLDVDALCEKAADLAATCNFKPLLSAHGGWLTTNEAKGVYG